MAKIEDEDEAFAEEECTMDFADEPEEVAPKTTAIPQNKFNFPEYPGEDFSQYLDDDDDFHAIAYMDPAPLAPTRGGGGRPKSTFEPTYPEETPWELALAAAAGPAEPEQRIRSTDVIKDRVSKWLNTVKRTKTPGGGNYYNQQGYGTTARLSDFSYNDAKICSTGPGSDSGISVRAHSDTGYAEQPSQTGGATNGKWEAEAPESTVRRKSGIGNTLAKMRKSKSSSNLSGYSGASLSVSSDGNNSPTASGSSAGKTLTNAWKKISTSLSRKPKFSNNASGEGQYSESALSYNSNNIYEDIRL